MSNPLLDAMQKAQPAIAKPAAKKATLAKPKQGTTPTALPPSREGTKQLTTSHLPEVLKQLHLLKIERDTTVQELMVEALNDLFKKHDKKPIA